MFSSGTVPQLFLKEIENIFSTYNYMGIAAKN